MEQQPPARAQVSTVVAARREAEGYFFCLSASGQLLNRHGGAGGVMEEELWTAAADYRRPL